MPVFFNGRLWTSPASMSAIDDSAMQNKNLSVGNVAAVIGTSVGGQPNTALRFGSPTEAKAALIDGELLKAVEKAFNPSNETGGPAEVIAIRVNPALQASLMLSDTGGNAVINLVAKDYGLRTNQIKGKVEAGSNKGLKLTTQLGNAYYVGDNLARNAFSIQYVGNNAAATLSVTGTTVTLQAPAGTVAATIDLNTYPTVQQLVDRINAVAGFSAAVLDGNGGKSALNGLDGATGQDVKTASFTVTANLQAVVDWLNSNAQGLVSAVRQPNALTLPAIMPFTYLSGGTDGIVTMNEWSNAFTTLQGVDVQAVAPISPNPAVWAMSDAHVQFMSTVGRMERRGFCGENIGTLDSQAMTDAKALNSDRTALMHIGFYDYDANGNLTLYPAYVMAGLIAGMATGVNPGTPLTNKSINVIGLERNLRNPTDTDALIQGGVFCVENTPKGYKVVKSVSTWLVNNFYDKVEISVGYACDFTVRNVREALDILRGQKATPLLLSRAVSITQSTLAQLAVAEPAGPGILTGDAQNPAYKNITASLSGDVVEVSYQCSPVLPANYVPQTAHVVPYSGSASA